VGASSSHNGGKDNGIPDREHFSDPSILNEVSTAILGLHHDIGAESVRLEAPLWVQVPEPVKRRGSQQMNEGGVEERPLRQREVRDSVSMLEAFHVQPILLGIGDRTAGAREHR